MLGKTGKLEEAIDHFQKALQLKPDIAEAHNNLGVVLAKIGKLDEAVEHYQEALQIRPDYAEARINLGNALRTLGKLDEAIEHYQKVLQIKADSIVILNELAWVLATVDDEDLRDPTESVRLGKRACELTQYSYPNLLDTLAVAYAADDDFAKAIETAEKALLLVIDNEKLTKKKQERIELYKANKPYNGK